MAELQILKAKTGHVVRIDNTHSIACSCAKAMYLYGVDLVIARGDERSEPHLLPPVTELKPGITIPRDVEVPGQHDALCHQIKARWGLFDFLGRWNVPDQTQHERAVDCSQTSIARAMDISCHSSIRMTNIEEVLMPTGVCLPTMVHFGAEQVVLHSGIRGSVKVASEYSKQYLAAALEPRTIRAHPLSCGPIRTHTAGGGTQFGGSVSQTRSRTPLRRPTSNDDVGALAVFLVRYVAVEIIGCTLHEDAAFHIIH